MTFKIYSLVPTCDNCPNNDPARNPTGPYCMLSRAIMPNHLWHCKIIIDENGDRVRCFYQYAKAVNTMTEHELNERD